MKKGVLLGPGELEGVDPVIELIQIAFLEGLIGQHLNYIMSECKQNEGMVSALIDFPGVVEG